MSKTIEAQAIEASLQAPLSPIEIKSKVDELLESNAAAEAAERRAKREERIANGLHYPVWTALTKEVAEELVASGKLFRSTEDFLIDRLSL